MLRYNYGVLVNNKKNEKLRMEFVGKKAREEAYSLCAELQHYYGLGSADVKETPQHKTYKNSTAALADAKFWIEH